MVYMNCYLRVTNCIRTGSYLVLVQVQDVTTGFDKMSGQIWLRGKTQAHPKPPPFLQEFQRTSGRVLMTTPV